MNEETKERIAQEAETLSGEAVEQLNIPAEAVYDKEAFRCGYYDGYTAAAGKEAERKQEVDRRIIQAQQEIVIAYRNKIAMSDDVTVQTILAMLEDDIKTLRTMDGDQMIEAITNYNNPVNK